MRRRPYASRSMRPPRSTRLGFQPPAIGEEEIAAVVETLRSGWLTTGPKAALLEERMADYFGAEHVLAVASGTAALHLALLAIGAAPERPEVPAGLPVGPHPLDALDRLGLVDPDRPAEHALRRDEEEHARPAHAPLGRRRQHS